MAQSQEYMRNYRRKNKHLAVEYMGGKCQMCGIVDECLSIYDFHHVEPKTKLHSLASMKCFRKMKEELKKCIMVCSNCHRKIHTGE